MHYVGLLGGSVYNPTSVLLTLNTNQFVHSTASVSLPLCLSHVSSLVLGLICYLADTDEAPDSRPCLGSEAEDKLRR